MKIRVTYYEIVSGEIYSINRESSRQLCADENGWGSFWSDTLCQAQGSKLEAEFSQRMNYCNLFALKLLLLALSNSIMA